MHNHELRTTNYQAPSTKHQAPTYRPTDLPIYRPTDLSTYRPIDLPATDHLFSPIPECDVGTRLVSVRRKGRKNRVVEPGCARWPALLGGFSRRRTDGGPGGPRCSVGFYGDGPIVAPMVRDARWDGERFCHGGLGIVRHFGRWFGSCFIRGSGLMRWNSGASPASDRPGGLHVLA